ncbi:MAG: glutamate-1-semialdehyde 2,1-aminomutase [Steroidobacteraceae bacterium]
MSKAGSLPLIDIVPGGGHTYSKGPDQFPSNAPTYIVRGEGCRVLGVDERWYIDWGMGLTSVALGHGNAEVCDSVNKEIRRGTNFIRPAVLEYEAAQKFLEVFGGDMVKFCKNGSVATTAAVKLARAATGKKLVAVPREHPFFSYDDWFIGTTAADAGIPQELKALTLRFAYNDLASLQALFDQHGDDIACVMLEPVKFDVPAPGFLQGIRALCDKYGAVYVLDETVSGLKWAMRGGQEYFGIDPDLSVWGKGLANGFSACALTGKRSIMALGGSNPTGTRVFLVSTTHGAESSALAAMLTTLHIFQRDDVIKNNWRRGKRLKAGIEAAIDKHGLKGKFFIQGYDCLLAFGWLGMPELESLAWKTLVMQELTREGLLTQGLLYPTPSHDDAVVEETIGAFDRGLASVAKAVAAGTLTGFLQGPAIKPVFRPFQECMKSRCGRLHSDEPPAPCCAR